MPPKKREKESDTSKNPRMDQIQADHELFLQAFEKPTQIYRFLRTRNMLSPVFLNRTLTYMKERMSRSHKNRKDFKVDSLLEKVKMKNREIQPDAMEGFMTLTFLGFYDSTIDAPQTPVKVETLLMKICHKKRKDVSSAIMQVSVGTSEVPINPSEDHPPPKAPTVSIPTESFSLSNGHLVKSYMLLLRVYCSSNGILLMNGDVDTEPAQKRRKSSGALKGHLEDTKLYGAELIVYDKHKRCLLTDGDYELVLQEVSTNLKGSPKKHSSWEAIGEIKEDCGPFEVFSSGPILKFRLNWTNEPSDRFVDRPIPLHPHDFSSDPVNNKENRPEKGVNISSNNNTNSIQGSKQPKQENQSGLQIVYQFCYNNNSKQPTEACEDLHCPWCSLDCITLYSLLKHLKLCHSRFTFTYQPIPNGARIDVSINECYDGSYTGSPHDLISQPPGYAFSRNGPVRRTSVSNILVCRPKRPKPSLSEFLELDDNEFDGQRPYITGHNRLYHHTTTCLPIFPKEMDVDSEGEHDPKWLQTKTMMMIDDFTDVNEGEKELMKMWNLHVMKHGYVGDCQIPLACSMFLESKGRDLLLKNLYRNFVLHMCSLFDFGLVSPVTLYTTVQKLQDLISENADVRTVLQEAWKAQQEHWLSTTGVNQNNYQDKSSNLQQGTSVCSETFTRRKTTQPLNLGGSQQNSSAKNQNVSMQDMSSGEVVRRKNCSQSTSSMSQLMLQKGSSVSNQSGMMSEISTQQRRKSTSSINQHSLPLGNIQQNSMKGSINNAGINSGNDNGLTQRRKSASSQFNSHSSGGPTSVGGSSLMVQVRRKSLNQQLSQMNANGNIHHFESSLPPLRRKSLNQISSNTEVNCNKNQNVSSNNSQGSLSSASDSSSIQHRRKSSNIQIDSTHLQIHTGKSSGS